MDWKRVLKVLAEALSPAPNVWDWLQILVLLVLLAGGAALIAWAEGVVPAAVVVVVVLAGLFLLAAYRLQGRLDEIESRQPMIALREDDDQGYQRLVVKNPNAFAVKRVYVELESLEKIDSRRPDLPAPSLGFRFPWTSWATEGGSLYMNFPPDAEIPVDIAALPFGASIQVDGEECFFFVHLAEKKETPVRATFYQAMGKYRLRLRLCSEDDDKNLPMGTATVVVEFDDQRRLAMQLVRDAENSRHQ